MSKLCLTCGGYPPGDCTGAGDLCDCKDWTNPVLKVQQPIVNQGEWNVFEEPKTVFSHPINPEPGIIARIIGARTKFETETGKQATVLYLGFPERHDLFKDVAIHVFRSTPVDRIEFMGMTVVSVEGSYLNVGV